MNKENNNSISKNSDEKCRQTLDPQRRTYLERLHRDSVSRVLFQQIFVTSERKGKAHRPDIRAVTAHHPTPAIRDPVPRVESWREGEATADMADVEDRLQQDAYAQTMFERWSFLLSVVLTRCS